MAATSQHLAVSELKKEMAAKGATTTRKKVGIDRKVNDFRRYVRSRHDFAIKTYFQTAKD